LNKENLKLDTTFVQVLDIEDMHTKY
jgi:hypothetical protein